MNLYKSLSEATDDKKLKAFFFELSEDERQHMQSLEKKYMKLLTSKS